LIKHLTQFFIWFFTPNHYIADFSLQLTALFMSLIDFRWRNIISTVFKWATHKRRVFLEFTQALMNVYLMSNLFRLLLYMIYRRLTVIHKNKIFSTILIICIILASILFFLWWLLFNYSINGFVWFSLRLKSICFIILVNFNTRPFFTFILMIVVILLFFISLAWILSF
jgi:hypothetical protein